MEDIKAGVIVKNKFCRSESNKFKQYINYMDRKEAVRTKYNMEYDLYADYMGNPEKTTGLFTNNSNRLSESEKKKMKKIFSAAQEKGSLMWQTVISFDNRWLKENGLFNNGVLDEKKIYEVTRKGIKKMLDKEGLQNAVWSASIHYNTDNIHVHVATVEPEPMRKVKAYQTYDSQKVPIKDKNGNPVTTQEQIGRFKLSSIEACKSTIANEIMKSRDINHKINSIIRGTILEQKKEHPLAKDRILAKAFFQLYKKLPDCDRKMWNYGTNKMSSIREDIDELSKKYIEQYHKSDYEELVTALKIQSLKYQEAYSTKMDPEEFVNNKLNDLYKRLGNTILKELREYDRAVHNEQTTYVHGKQLAFEGKQEEDRKEGIAILTGLAERDNVYAQVSLGTYYLKKDYGEQNLPMARYWLEKAQEQGNEFAGKILTDMERWEKKKSGARKHIHYGAALSKAIRSLKWSMNKDYEEQRNEWEYEMLTRIQDKNYEYDR